MADRIDPRLAPYFESLGYLPGEVELRTKGLQLVDFLGAMDPVQGIMRGMSAAGTASDPDVSTDERYSAAIEAGLETAAPLLGMGFGRLLQQPVKRVVVENLTLAGMPDAPEAQFNDVLFPNGPDFVDDGLVDVADVYDELDDPGFNIQWEPEPEPVAPPAAQTAPLPPIVLPQFDDVPVEAGPWPVPPDQFNPLEDGPDILGDFDPLEGDPDILEQIVNEFQPDFLPFVPVTTDLVPTLGRAALSLEQPRYGSYEEVLSNLRRLGAKNPEIEASGIRSLEGTQGPITKDMVEAAIAEDNPLRLIRLGAGTDLPTQYDRYFTPGGGNYREVVIQAPSGMGANDVVRPSHFRELGPNQLVHYRAAEFPVVGSGDSPVGMSFHIGEIQSDWAQNRTARNREIALANMDAEDAEEWYDKNVRKPINRYDTLVKEKYKIHNDLDKFGDIYADTDWYDAQVKRLEEVYRQMDDAQGARDNAFNKAEEFQLYFNDVSEMEDYPVWERNDYPAPDPLPDNAVVRDTNELTRLALRQALVDAAKSDTQYVTLGTGQMATEMTGGTLSGQQEYYDRILPRQLKELFKRLGREYEIEMPEIMDLGIRTEEDVGFGSTPKVRSVPGFVMTDELRRAILDDGMSMFRYGGLV